MTKLFALVLAFAISAQATTYYIDYDGGSDSNNGTSKTTPWKHHPYMGGRSGGSYTHAVGDHFYFKGGVTWPNAALPLVILNGGAAGNYDYYGADVTWFTGASFTKPIFNGGGVPYVNNWQDHRQNIIRVYGSAYTHFDNLKLINWVVSNLSGFAGCSGINAYNSWYLLVTDCYIGEWVIADWDCNAAGVQAGYQSGGIEVYNTVVRGALTIPAEWTDDPDPGWFGHTSGFGFKDLQKVEGCEVTYTSNPIWNCREVYNNYCVYNGNDCNTWVHENAVRIHGDSIVAGNIFKWHYEGTGGVFIPGWSGATGNKSWVYNNIFISNFPQIWTGSTSSGSVGTDNEMWFVNNVIVDQWTDAEAADDAMVRANNIFISDYYTTLDSVLRDHSYMPINVKSNNVVLTKAQAAAVGMTEANNYRPTSQLASVYNMGLDFSYDVLGLNSPQKLTFTTDFDGYTRPVSTAWDIGAYEFQEAKILKYSSASVLVVPSNAHLIVP